MANPDRLEHLLNRMLGTETEWELDELHSKLNQAVVNNEGFEADSCNPPDSQV